MNKIVTICSSMKNQHLFSQVENALVSLGYVPLLPVSAGEHLPEDKLEATHIAKIDLADTIIVITPYGNTTAKEIKYALSTYKRVFAWNDIIDNAIKKYARANNYKFSIEKGYWLTPVKKQAGARLGSNTIEGLVELIGGFEEIIKYADELY